MPRTTAHTLIGGALAPLLTAMAVGVSAVAVAAPVRAASPSPAPSSGTSASTKPARATIGVQTATATSPDKRPHYAFELGRGAVLIDHLAVFNYSLKPVRVRLSAHDAGTGRDGTFSVAPGSSRKRDVGAWLAFGTPEVTIPARERVIVAFQVGVPYNAEPGDHAGAALVTLVTPGNTPAGRQIEVENRIGMRVYVRVAGKLVTGLQVSPPVARFEGTWSPTGRGPVTVDYVLRNTGNVRLAAAQAVRLSGLLPGAGQVHLPLVKELLPGSSIQVHARFAHVFGALRLNATATVTPIRLRDEHGPSAPVPTAPVVRASSFWALPIVLLLLLVSLAVTFTLFRRRQRRIAASRGRHLSRGRKAATVASQPVGVS